VPLGIPENTKNMIKLNPATLTIATLFAVVASAYAGEPPLQAVPEGGATFGLLTVGLIALAAFRRKMAK
jgi:hypothetical protein